VEEEPLEEIEVPQIYVPRQPKVPLPLPTEVDLDPLLDELRDAEVAKMMLPFVQIQNKYLTRHMYSFLEED